MPNDSGTNAAGEQLPEIAYYYPEPYWMPGEGDWLKTLLLFFDEVAILLPQYMRGRPEAADPVLAGPLLDQGLLRILEPETFVDQEVTERLTEIMVVLITENAFDGLEHPPYYAELSRSRMGWNADVELSEMLIEELKARDLAHDSEDRVSVPLHPAVRTTILVILSQLAREAGRRQGLGLHPTTASRGAVDALVGTLALSPMPSAGQVVALDLEQVTLNLTSVSLDEVLDFRALHGPAHRAYMHNLRQFTLELSLLSAEERERALVDRREELADKADNLRRLARKAWKRSLASFGLGAAGAAWTGTLAGVAPALLSLGSNLVGGLPMTDHGSAYSYLFAAQHTIGSKPGPLFPYDF